MKLNESKYYQGTQRFSWPVQIQLSPSAEALRGEVRILDGDGHFTFEFGNQAQDEVVAFSVRDFAVRVPSFVTYIGSERYKTAITIPAFTVSGSNFKEARGFLQTSTGKFVLTLSLDITANQAPFLPELQSRNLLRGFDVSSLTAHLFESGSIDPDTGRFEATGTLYVGDKQWRSPKDPPLIIATADQGGCTVTAHLWGTVRPFVQGHTALGTTIVICPGDPVTLVYETKGAATATLIGDDGTSLNLVPPDAGSVTVSPKNGGEVRYHVRAQHGCVAISEDVVVTVVTPDTVFNVTAVLARHGLDTSTGDSIYDWEIDLTNLVSERVMVQQIAKAYSSSGPVDGSGERIDHWVASAKTRGGSISSPAFTYFKVPLMPAIPLAALWTFSAITGFGIAAGDPRDRISLFIMWLTCS